MTGALKYTSKMSPFRQQFLVAVCVCDLVKKGKTNCNVCDKDNTLFILLILGAGLVSFSSNLRVWIGSDRGVSGLSDSL